MKKKMVSYKTLYEEMQKKYDEQIEFLKTEAKSGYLCPICGNPLVENQSEFYCSNEECTFDKTLGDLIYFYAEYNDLERDD